MDRWRLLEHVVEASMARSRDGTDASGTPERTVPCRIGVGAVRPSGSECDPMLSQDLDRSRANPVESEQLSLAGAIEVSDCAITRGFEGSGGWSSHLRRQGRG